VGNTMISKCFKTSLYVFCILAIYIVEYFVNNITIVIWDNLCNSYCAIGIFAATNMALQLLLAIPALIAANNHLLSKYTNISITYQQGIHLYFLLYVFNCITDLSF